MYCGLKETTRLRREKEAVVVFSASDTGDRRLVHPVYGMMLTLCNGQNRRSDLVRVAHEVLSWPEEEVAERVDGMLRDFDDFVVVSPEPLDVRQRYNPLDFLYTPQGDPEKIRLSAPISVTWLVTERCPCECVYCCIHTVPATAHPPGELTSEEAFSFLENCVETGVELFVFHGGEPFLRPDVPELMGFLIDRGVWVMASTKMRLRENVVARLAEVGLEELQVSLDSPTPAVADRLVGKAGHLARVHHNLELLQRYGIAPKVNTVVTDDNVAEVPQLLRALIDKGVTRFSLSGYIRSAWKHDDRFFPGHEKLWAMAEEVEEITAGHDGVQVELCPLESPREVSLATKGYSACGGGKSSLVVGAYGEVTLCDRLLSYPEAIVGNVKEENLLEIWNGERLRSFLEPDPEAFAGTECHACGLREMCDQRIRCYYRSKLITDRIFAPDYLCHRMPSPIRFF